MNTLIHPINDSEFLRQFEDKTLDPEYFDHLGHMRLAWLYLTQHNLDKALALICDGIRAYAESHGDNEKFHLTLTNAMARIMALRIGRNDDKSWDSFLRENEDLVKDFLSVLHRYYSQDLLWSETARTTLVAPDLEAI